MANVESIEEGKKERQRSPNYPAVGLREAVERVRKLIQIDGKAGAPPEIAAKHIGYSSAHGQAMSVLAALKKFALLTESSGRLVPTQAALEIANLPESDPRRARALKESALSPILYKQLVEDHRETGLPAPEVLEAELTTYKGFNPRAVAGFVSDFKDTLDFAGIQVGKEVELEMDKKPEVGGGAMEAVLEREEREQKRDFGGSNFFGTLLSREKQEITRRYPFDISIPRSLKAELAISGEFRKEDLERLRNQVGRLIDNLVEAFAD